MARPHPAMTTIVINRCSRFINTRVKPGFTLLLGLMMTLLVAVSLPSWAERPAHIAAPSWTSQLENDITRHVALEERKAFTTDEDESFSALYLPYMSAEKRGIAILIPDWQHSPMDNNGFSYLRQALTDDGFDTYAVVVPEINWQADIATQSEEQAQNAQDSAVHFITEAVLDDYKKRLFARFSKIYESLAMSQSEQLVVIAQGTSAGVLAEYLARMPSLRVNALVTVSAMLPNSNRNKHLPATLSLVGPALLDLYYSADTPLITDSMHERNRWARRNAKYDYRQRELFGLPYEARQHVRLRKEVDGFLRQL
ncbi:DUF3530 family protein [Pseudoalteromonas fenneropenaei]|uniref:DUF3530 family protein n=1 Tax=Pseudoalteromonas fenneropenaei TaxID=1737459 RepID=A0ABV7CLF4_9GAMM